MLFSSTTTAGFLSVKVRGKKKGTASSTRQSFTIAWPRTSVLRCDSLSLSFSLQQPTCFVTDRSILSVVTSPDLHPLCPFRPLCCSFFTVSLVPLPFTIILIYITIYSGQAVCIRPSWYQTSNTRCRPACYKKQPISPASLWTSPVFEYLSFQQFLTLSLTASVYIRSTWISWRDCRWILLCVIVCLIMHSLRIYIILYYIAQQYQSFISIAIVITKLLSHSDVRDKLDVK